MRRGVQGASAAPGSREPYTNVDSERNFQRRNLRRRCAMLHAEKAAAARRAAPRRALADKVRMALGVAQGMQALEAAQPPILHRDLKPRRAAHPRCKRPTRHLGPPVGRAADECSGAGPARVAPVLPACAGTAVSAWRHLQQLRRPACTRLSPNAGMKSTPHVCLHAMASPTHRIHAQMGQRAFG